MILAMHYLTLLGAVTHSLTTFADYFGGLSTSAASLIQEAPNQLDRVADILRQHTLDRICGLHQNSRRTYHAKHAT